MQRCLQEIAIIEAELLAGNPDVQGLCMALRDWHAELRILEEEQRAQGQVVSPEEKEAN